MTDNDIINAKEFFQHIVYYKGFSELEKKYAKVALSAFLLVEQQRKDIDYLRERACACMFCDKTEEIERLKAIESTEEKQHHYCKDVCYPNHKAEIERLTEEKDNLIRTYKECQVAILVDFAEKLMGVYTDKFGSTKESLVSYIVQKEIKKLVKEMTEETK